MTYEGSYLNQNVVTINNMVKYRVAKLSFLMISVNNLEIAVQKGLYFLIN